MEALSHLQNVHYSSLSLSQVMRPQVSGGKIALPVNSYSVYAQFKHIEAVPAGPNGSGYTLSKARLLDTLIDRLVQLKERNQALSPQETAGLPTEAIDALIQEYAQKLSTAVQSGLPKLQQDFGTSFGSSAGLSGTSALMFDLSI
ncbi:MAG: hypothetical protein GW949_01620 [Spirochaetales bacterium]|nr:hypothetical protein [Spirochaetales bacterium]